MFEILEVLNGICQIKCESKVWFNDILRILKNMKIWIYGYGNFLQLTMLCVKLTSHHENRLGENGVNMNTGHIGQRP
jgi:hypothetical protein